MKPLKFSDIVIETAERCGQSADTTALLLKLYFKELRTALSSLSYPGVQILNLGTFVLKPNAVKRKLVRKQVLLQKPRPDNNRSSILQQELMEEIEAMERVLKMVEEEKERKRLFVKSKAYGYGKTEQFDTTVEEEREDI